MKIIFDKIGYILIIVGFLLMLYKYGSYLLYETTFLIIGNKEELEIDKVEKIEEKYIYYFKLNNESNNIYSTLPTNKVIFENSIVIVRTIPIFQRVYIGEFLIGSYIVGILLLLIGIAVSTLSIWMIFGIENKYTLRIKQAYK